MLRRLLREEAGRVTSTIVGTMVAATILIGAYATAGGGGTTDVWVTTTGNDGTCVRGNQSLPCLTVTRALELAQNGDQVEVAAGTYSSAQTWAGSNTVTVVAATGASPAFSAWIQVTASNLTVDGLDFTFTPPENDENWCTGAGAPNDRGASMTVSGANLTFRNGTIAAHMAFDETADGFLVEDSTVHAFDLWRGPDNWTIDTVLQDVEGISYCGDIGLLSGTIMSANVDWEILNSTFTHHNNDADPEQHSEALYIGAFNDNGLIQGNTFLGDPAAGSTGHIFFTTFGGGTSDGPTDICVTGNTFDPPINPFWFIDMHATVPDTNNIDIEPSPDNTFNFDPGPDPNQELNDMDWLRAC